MAHPRPERPILDRGTLFPGPDGPFQTGEAPSQAWGDLFHAWEGLLWSVRALSGLEAPPWSESAHCITERAPSQLERGPAILKGPYSSASYLSTSLWLRCISVQSHLCQNQTLFVISGWLEKADLSFTLSRSPIIKFRPLTLIVLWWLNVLFTLERVSLGHKFGSCMHFRSFGLGVRPRN